MKKKRLLVLAVAVCILLASISYSLADIQYKDSVAGVSFTIPNGWVKKDLDKERQTIDVKYVRASSQEMGVLLFGSTDIWSTLSSEMKKEIGNNKANINNSMFTTGEMKELIKDLAGSEAKNVQKKTFNGYEYYYAVTDSTVVGVSIQTIYALRFANGYQYMFQLMGTKDKTYESDLHTILNSAKYTSEGTASLGTQTESNKGEYVPATSGSNGNSFVLSLITGIILTAAVYTLPIAAYRLIKKTPFEPKKAKKVTIIYAACAFLVMSVLLRIINDAESRTGYSIILWSFINYKILTAGYKEHAGNNITSEHDVTTKQEDIISDEQIDICTDEGKSNISQSNKMTYQALYCNQCGNKLAPNSKYCNHCGAIVANRED